MVRFLKRRQSLDKPSQDKNMSDMIGRQVPSFTAEHGRINVDDKWFRSHGAIEEQQIRSVFDRSENRTPKFRVGEGGSCPSCGAGLRGQPSDVELMKERFAKLLLGEDMSGGGKGVSSALALSNAITNHAASVFGEQEHLEPMAAERKARWRREIDWLLAVTDHIVELVPSQQVGDDGTKMEIMTTQQRRDLLMNIPALRKLDAMLIGYLDDFKDQNEFWYVKGDEESSEKWNLDRKDDKWWLPAVKVPPNGLSEISRKWLQFQKESVNQVLKAAMAINAQVLMEMEIPEAYIDSLPKNGKASLGEFLYRSITAEFFDPEQFLASIDLSTEHRVLDLKNRIEASVVIWKRKMHNKDGKSWSSSVSLEKREQFEERAETILRLLKHRFPGTPQSALDISKIQFNKDVGQAVLESYSRVLESLAYTVMSRIEDVLYADQLAQDPIEKLYSRSSSKLKEEMENEDSEQRTSMTLSDYMGWPFEQVNGNEKTAPGNFEDLFTSEESELKKLPKIVTPKKVSYIEKVENLGGLRSPTSRH
ncbi:rho guanine nucleotide exchange factor 8-like [Phalaenopsis equestris]|uniref:rho guanine nucleotide exchange factor 8-like n=1 Tax=Phalaenopsis equestris TaxID=78828 RepID=UPI0009E30627|nr:rho guanine nucleotide exchange factor 8-like [Phalaenopsis equestris]XP_020585743.1 rho guanine nucleotide exchange factor 8-like [Phalaenopsis equestris]